MRIGCDINLYYIAEVRDTIRVVPNRFGDNLEEVVLEICRETFEGTISKDLGLTIVVIDVSDIGPGRLVPGDGAAFYDVLFTTLNYLPEDREFVIGDVVEVTDFGVFLRLGCVDALCHVSQVSDDFFSYNSKQGALIGRDSQKRISVGDRVRSRITHVSIGKSLIRIGVTMRQAGLGVESWVEEWKKAGASKKKAAAKDTSTKKKTTDKKTAAKKTTDKKTIDKKPATKKTTDKKTTDKKPATKKTTDKKTTDKKPATKKTTKKS
ncbi:MAG: DNA-directed RNA polymerase [Asgard group archaeon]|nr:DNA-directed RNA polymerase [Asgard group archaeon]